MYLSKSIDFLQENAGCIIKYRLGKEILKNLTPTEEENLLAQIYQTPYFKLVESYVRPNGYIGNGMHGHSNWRDTVLHKTPLEDGENAARLLSLYAIPKTHPIVANYISVMRDEKKLRDVFSDYPTNIKRYEKRYTGIESGNCLMGLMYTMQAMLGYGDDHEDVRAFQETCLQGFRQVLTISSYDEITEPWPSKSNKYGYRIIDTGAHFPGVYTLTMLAYTQTWRIPENVQMLADALNHINHKMQPSTPFLINTYENKIGPMGALASPIAPFRADDVTVHRKTLTEVAMLGVGKKADIVGESIANILSALDSDGILRMDFNAPHNKHYSPKNIKYPSGYGNVRLEPHYEPRKKEPIGLLCDLTFWAVQFLHLANYY